MTEQKPMSTTNTDLAPPAPKPEPAKDKPKDKPEPDDKPVEHTSVDEAQRTGRAR
jgi:hypothetical protein